MKTTNSIKVSDRMIYRYYRGIYYRDVNALKLYPNMDDFKIGNSVQLRRVYDVVATMLLKHLITAADAERLTDLSTLYQMVKFQQESSEECTQAEDK